MRKFKIIYFVFLIIIFFTCKKPAHKDNNQKVSADDNQLELQDNVLKKNEEVQIVRIKDNISIFLNDNIDETVKRLGQFLVKKVEKSYDDPDLVIYSYKGLAFGAYTSDNRIISIVLEGEGSDQFSTKRGIMISDPEWKIKEIYSEAVKKINNEYACWYKVKGRDGFVYHFGISFFIKNEKIIRIAVYLAAD